MKINHAVRTLIISDFVTNAGFGVFAPIFAVFVTQQIDKGSLEVIGYAVAIGQIFKCVLQIPIARILDKDKGEQSDYYSLMFGSILVSFTPFIYLFASQPVHIYIAQAVFGTGMAFAVPPWYAIFTRHIDKMHENIEWSLDSVSIGISSAAAAALGGILADRFGFDFVFLLGGVLCIYGITIISRIYKDLKAKVGRDGVRPNRDHNHKT